MARQAKTQRMLDAALAALQAYKPMTVRQVYYQLVSGQVIENTVGQYKAVSNLLVAARKSGEIPWEWIEDRLRRPRAVGMWSGLSAFAETARQAYRRDVWETQPDYLEVWLEKDALSGIFEDALGEYGVTLNVGRGFDGWDSIRNANSRYKRRGGATVLYFGDFDPSGEDMVRSLRERLGWFGYTPDVIKCALTMDDIRRYQLPPDFAKKTDSRAAKFIAKHGDVSVELDALPTPVLQARLTTEIEKRMDMVALGVVRLEEAEDIKKLVRVLSAV